MDLFDPHLFQTVFSQFILSNVSLEPNEAELKELEEYVEMKQSWGGWILDKTIDIICLPVKAISVVGDAIVWMVTGKWPKKIVYKDGRQDPADPEKEVKKILNYVCNK